MSPYRRSTAKWAALVAAAAFILLRLFALALADEGPGDCLGIDFDPQHPVVIGKVTAANPRAYFVKSATDDAACPAATVECQDKSYLIPGNLALIGKTFLNKANVAYTCVSYESADAKKSRWTNGWLPSASLTPAAPMAAPKRTDWIGEWVHASGNISIASAAGGSLTIQGEAFYDAAQDVHTGVISATAKPARNLLEFAEDGSTAFTDPSAECLVRMQRIDAILVVEDNGGCGGALVTFTGFYRRK